MRFEGTFELEDVTKEELWLALSDPVMIQNALPGCQFLIKVNDESPDFDELERSSPDELPETLPEADPEIVSERGMSEGDHYAALVKVGLGSVKPSFETVVTISEREIPKMRATGKGGTNDSSFELDSGMELVETNEGVEIHWWSEVDIYGRIAQMGQRVINPVASRIVNSFFSNIEDELSEVSDTNSSLRSRINDLVR